MLIVYNTDTYTFKNYDVYAKTSSFVKHLNHDMNGTWPIYDSPKFIEEFKRDAITQINKIFAFGV